MDTISLGVSLVIWMSSLVNSKQQSRLINSHHVIQTQVLLIMRYPIKPVSFPANTVNPTKRYDWWCARVHVQRGNREKSGVMASIVCCQSRIDMIMESQQTPDTKINL
ncbi:hypothetical protein BOTBODRAFT_642765 [Botryobasidium botryosum FD-172 SS1]|uniref:Uncharacterized protein n=1 Tax=Botryobasidium botryosum (strain FD-172 SS1) TaxID=930990 RepID=A0A067M1D2_BOTB1|nr:hypothetical protein BOTBODRAFT_642765 [Botryobasidium botryosum FD-172 SS1]